ncbi:MAG: aromatic aminobenezylarsenical efflux permease ArsG family transporter [Thermodesulfovibrionales bacterium]
MEIFLLFSAMWLGILTSISPCPLASNIAAVSFISNKITHKNIVFFSGILYSIGRSLTYIILGFLIVKAMVDIPLLSDFLQRYMNKILGIVLIFTGMVLLEMIHINLPSLPFSEKFTKKITGRGIFGATLLGVLFAMAFCPVSAALFFGGLIPLSIKAESVITLPLIYGIGTGLPVLVFGTLFALGIEYFNRVYRKVNKLENYTKSITGIIFILIGIYYSLAYIFEIF